MGVSYATRAQVYRLVPRGTLGEAARVVANADASLDRLELGGHGFEDSDPLQFQVDQGGVLPAPLALLTVYYAKLVDIGGGVKSDGLLQVSASPGGAAINLTDVGTKPYRVYLPVDALIDVTNEIFSRWLDGKLPAHGVPLAAPYPAWVSDAVALRTAARLVRRKSLSQYAGLLAEEDTLLKDVASLVRGIPLRDDSVVTGSTNLATSESIDVDAGRGAIP
jgi:hypothetical protein